MGDKPEARNHRGRRATQGYAMFLGGNGVGMEPMPAEER
jgi:hypothetical protein